MSAASHARPCAHPRAPSAPRQAIGASVRGHAKLTDSEARTFLAGLRSLDVSGCATLTDAAFAAIAPSLHTLVMRDLKRVSDCALVHVAAARVLDVSGCAGITGRGLLACPALVSHTLQALRAKRCRSVRRDDIARIRAGGVSDVPMLYQLVRVEGGVQLRCKRGALMPLGGGAR